MVVRIFQWIETFNYHLSSISLTFKHTSDAWATTSTTLRLTTGSFPQVPSTLFPGQSVWWICHWMRSCPRCGETRDGLEEWCTNTRLQLLLVWLSGQAFVKVLKVNIHHFTFHWISIFHFDLYIYMVILMGLWSTWFEGGQVIWNEIILDHLHQWLIAHFRKSSSQHSARNLTGKAPLNFQPANSLMYPFVRNPQNQVRFHVIWQLWGSLFVR